MITEHAVSRGLLSNNILLGITTDGLIYIPVVIPPAYIGGGGWAVPDLRKRERERRREILEDDSEILEYLAMIMPIINN